MKPTKLINYQRTTYFKSHMQEYIHIY